MAMTYSAILTTHWKQHLENLGSGANVVASEVRVYHLKRDGTKGHLKRIEKPGVFESPTVRNLIRRGK